MALSNITGVVSIALEAEERLRALPRTSMRTVRRLRREFSQRLSNAPSFVLREIASLLLFQPGLKFRLFAYELLGNSDDALFSLRPCDLSQLAIGIDSRSSADAFALAIVGPLWRERRIPEDLMHSWAKSGSRWWKRIAVVSAINQVQINRTGPKIDSRNLKVLKIALADRSADVVTGLLAALRPLLRSNFAAARELFESLGIANHPALRRLLRRRQRGPLGRRSSQKREALLAHIA